MAQAEIHEVLSVDPEKLFEVITRYEDYGQYVEGCSGAKVLKREGNQILVEYSLNLIKEISYQLMHTEDPANKKMSWTLVSSEFLKKNTGSWELKPAGPGKTDVKYSLEVEFKLPVPGLILNRLVKSSLPTMLKNFEKRARG